MDYMHHKLTCKKCGRKILVEIILMGTSHNAGVLVTCAECLGKLDEKFCKEHPEEAESIKAWINE